MMDNSCCILFFVKYPRPGRTKSRLGKIVGDKHAQELYRRFVADLLDMLERIDGDVVVCFDPFESIEKYRQWLGGNLMYESQAGYDIGERMSNSLQWAFEAGYSKAVVIGSDSPDLPESHLEKAFHELDINDAVIGPTSDGGYYLIGFKAESFTRRVFEGINWSSGGEFNETIRVFSEQKNDLSVYVLDMWHDIDVADDLKGLITRNEQTKFIHTLTYEYSFDIVRRKL